METDNKIEETDNLLDCIASELERVEMDLQTVYDCHVQYDSCVQAWLTWFAVAKRKLSACRMEETNEQIVDGKENYVIQVRFFRCVYHPKQVTTSKFSR